MNIDKSIIKTYKTIFYELISKPEKWYGCGTGNSNFGIDRILYKCEINSKNKTYFKIDEDNNIYLKCSDNVMYTFYTIVHWKMLMKIYKLRRYLKHKERNEQLKIQEKILIDSIPSEFIRSIKINKIKREL